MAEMRIEEALTLAGQIRKAFALWEKGKPAFDAIQTVLDHAAQADQLLRVAEERRVIVLADLGRQEASARARLEQLETRHAARVEELDAGFAEHKAAADQQRDTLSRELDSLSAQLQGARKALQQAQESHRMAMVGMEREASARRKQLADEQARLTASLSQELQETKEKLATAKEALAALKARLG